jgi:hypothetical protein
MRNKTARILKKYAQDNGYSERSVKDKYLTLTKGHRCALKKAITHNFKIVGGGEVGVTG